MRSQFRILDKTFNIRATDRTALKKELKAKLHNPENRFKKVYEFKKPEIKEKEPKVVQMSDRTDTCTCTCMDSTNYISIYYDRRLILSSTMGATC